MKKARITEADSDKIHSLISVKTFTWQDIANAFDNKYTLNQIQYHVKKYYPNLKKNIVKEYSRGGTKLEYLLKQIFPADKISAEFHLGERLRVDFLVAAPYNIAFEFDGSQHSEYSSHFHGSQYGLVESQGRDDRKEELLSKRGISLVRISQLTIDESALRKMIQHVGYGDGQVQPDALTYKERKRLLEAEQRKKASEFQKQSQREYKNRIQSSDNSYAEQQKERQRQYRKEQYQRQKEWLKKNKK